MDFLASLGIVTLAGFGLCVGAVVGAVGGLVRAPAVRWGVLALGAAMAALLIVLAVSRHDGQPWVMGRGQPLADSEGPLGALLFRSILASATVGLVAMWLVVGGLRRGKS